MDNPGFTGVGCMSENVGSLMSGPYDLYSTPVLENAVVSSRTISRRPESKDGDMLEFYLSDLFPYHCSMKTALLYLRCRVMRGDGQPWESNVETGVVAPVNLVGPSLFHAVDIELQHKQCPELGNNLFHYKNYLDIMTSFGLDAQNTHLTCMGYFPDTAKAFQDTRANDCANTGFYKRRKLVKKGRAFDIVMPILSDFLMCEQPLIPKMKLKITLRRSPPSFYLMTNQATAASDANFYIKFDEVQLTCTFLELRLSLRETHMKLHKKKPVRMPMIKTRMQSYDIPRNFNAQTIDVQEGGQIAKMMFVVMVPSRNFHGHLEGNPYEFKHFNIDYAFLRISGEMYPAVPYAPRFNGDAPKYIRDYIFFLQQLGLGFADEGGWMSPELYANGFFVQAYDLSPDQCAGWHNHGRKEAKIELELKFLQPLEENVTVIIYSLFDAVALIHNDGRAQVELGE